MDYLFVGAALFTVIFIILFGCAGIWRYIDDHLFPDANAQDFALYNLVFGGDSGFTLHDILLNVRRNNANVAKPYVKQSRDEIEKLLELWTAKGFLYKIGDRYFFTR